MSSLLPVLLTLSLGKKVAIEGSILPEPVGDEFSFVGEYNQNRVSYEIGVPKARLFLDVSVGKPS